jgi:hypothetical protein
MGMFIYNAIVKRHKRLDPVLGYWFTTNLYEWTVKQADNGKLTDLLMPNGKRLHDCTRAERDELEGLITEIEAGLGDLEHDDDEPPDVRAFTKRRSFQRRSIRRGERSTT